MTESYTAASTQTSHVASCADAEVQNAQRHDGPEISTLGICKVRSSAEAEQMPAVGQRWGGQCIMVLILKIKWGHVARQSGLEFSMHNFNATGAIDLETTARNHLFDL
jgi:hypothetical protein